MTVLTRWMGLGRRSSEIHRTESFRLLRTNLEVVLLDLEHPSVVVTSALPGEGKSATCAQLALALALAGRRVVVVDCDLRHPTQHQWFGVANTKGVTDVLLERCPVEEALAYLSLGTRRRPRGIYLLPAGASVDNPTELLTGARMARLLDSLIEQADIVLIDSAPVLPVADSLVIGRMVAGVLLVVESRVTTSDSAIAARDALVRNQARILGVVVNKVSQRDVPISYGYGSYASASDDG